MHINLELNWFFWNSVRLTLYNVIMLLPLGVYLKVLFNKRHKKGCCCHPAGIYLHRNLPDRFHVLWIGFPQSL